MAIESGTTVDLSYVAEVTQGVTPGSPSMKLLRSTGRNLNLVKNVLESEEVRSDREITDVRHGFNRVEGSVPFEWAVGSYDDMLEAALSGTWTTISTSGVDLGITGTNTITRASGSFITQGYRVGDYVIMAGWTTPGNNTTIRVTAVTATTLVTDTVLTNETSGAGRTIDLRGKRVSVGTTLRTFTFERRFLGITQYQVFRGVAVGGFDFRIQPESMVGGTLSLLGMSSPALSGSSLGTPAASATNSPFAAFDGAIYEGGTVQALITGITGKLANGRQLTPVVSSKFSPAVFEGRSRTELTVTALFDSAAALNRFINETESSIQIRMNDPNGTDFHSLVFPRIKYVGGMIDPPQEGPLVIELPCRALRDSVSGTSWSIQRSNT